MKTESERAQLISSYEKKILQWASRVAHRYVTKSDDLFSIALIAFNDAIDSYQKGKGSFSAFAKKTVQNRIIDYLRTESREKAVPFSSVLPTNDEDDKSKVQIESPQNHGTEAAIEIFSLSEELKQYGIDFYTLSKYSPTAKKTREICKTVAKTIATDPICAKTLFEQKRLPINALCDKTTAKRKQLEKYRKYIITGAIIYKNGYTCIGEYYYGGDQKT